MTTAAEAEFTALVHRQSRFVFRVAYAVLLNAADAEDAVQETFLKLYRSGEWRTARDERAYLARVAWRAAIDRRRSLARPEDATGDLPDRPGFSPDPEQSAVAAGHHARIHVLIDALPEDLRIPLVLSAAEDMNSRQIATALGIPEGTVRTRLQRARQLLRQKLTACEEVPHA